MPAFFAHSIVGTFWMKLLGWIAYVTKNACDRSNILPETKNCAEYTMIYEYYFVWDIVIETSKEIVKNIKRREILSKNLQQWVEKWDSTMDNDKIVHRKQQEQDR